MNTRTTLFVLLFGILFIAYTSGLDEPMADANGSSSVSGEGTVENLDVEPMAEARRKRQATTDRPSHHYGNSTHASQQKD